MVDNMFKKYSLNLKGSIDIFSMLFFNLWGFFKCIFENYKKKNIIYIF